MKYEIRNNLDWVYVRTKGMITNEDRKTIISRLKARGLERPLAGILIDHTNAVFQDPSLGEIDCGRLVSEINLKNKDARIFVIASPLNRRSIDMVAMAAHKDGVPVQVCLSQEEAVLKIARFQADASVADC